MGVPPPAPTPITVTVARVSPLLSARVPVGEGAVLGTPLCVCASLPASVLRLSTHLSVCAHISQACSFPCFLLSVTPAASGPQWAGASSLPLPAVTAASCHPSDATSFALSWEAHPSRGDRLAASAPRRLSSHALGSRPPAASWRLEMLLARGCVCAAPPAHRGRQKAKLLSVALRRPARLLAPSLPSGVI